MKTTTTIISANSVQIKFYRFLVFRRNKKQGPSFLQIEDLIKKSFSAFVYSK